jgi:hypothetical protein
MKHLFIAMITTGCPPLDRNPEVTRSRVEEPSARGLLKKWTQIYILPWSTGARISNTFFLPLCIRICFHIHYCSKNVVPENYLNTRPYAHGHTRSLVFRSICTSSQNVCDSSCNINRPYVLHQVQNAFVRWRPFFTKMIKSSLSFTWITADSLCPPPISSNNVQYVDGRTPLPQYTATSCTWYAERYNYHRQHTPLKCMASQVWPQHYFKTSEYALGIKVTVGYRKLNTGVDFKYGLLLDLFLSCSGSTFLQNGGRLIATRYRNPKAYHLINNLRTVQSCYNRINTKITGSLHWESYVPVWLTLFKPRMLTHTITIMDVVWVSLPTTCKPADRISRNFVWK